MPVNVYKDFKRTTIIQKKLDYDKIYDEDGNLTELVNWDSYNTYKYTFKKHDNGYYFTYDKIGNHPYHHAGMIYVQEPAAMAPAECVDIDPQWKILDMCAAPGGKSFSMANVIQVQFLRIRLTL